LSDALLTTGQALKFSSMEAHYIARQKSHIGDLSTVLEEGVKSQ